MTYEQTPPIIVLILGILALIKAVWGVVRPAGLQSVARWWAEAPRQLRVVMGTIAILIGLALWLVVLAGQPLSNWILVIYGVLLIWAGTLYFRPGRFVDFLNRTTLNRSLAAVRLISIGIGLVAGLLIWIAIRGM